MRKWGARGEASGGEDGQRRGTSSRRRVLCALGGWTLVAGGAIALEETVLPGASSLEETALPSASRAAASPPMIAARNAVTASGAHSPAGGSARPAGAGAAPLALGDRRVPVPPPGAEIRSAPVWYVDGRGSKAIALTLDDGPDPVYTPQALDLLAAHGITATFNMVGRQVAQHLSLVREVAAAGHAITNHTWDHSDPRRLTYAQTCAQIDRCNQVLADAGQHPRIFRAPYGNWTRSVYRACAAYGLTPVAWSVDPRDWARPGVGAIVTNVLTHTRSRDIILEHDGGGNRAQTIAAMRIFHPRATRTRISVRGDVRRACSPT
ncbi:polysaccharide deacetylase family protein [Actinospica sp. MGRD01-02]|uniref:Polysaccharide deacetylase family protein n=1 Tax=Actinospica acidithermotolerans TaxID=2828514 RepID=A0A941IIM4_9ACTN|nr:polysaccharide deacetylase family protein [Actinospica acidithermotolerans]MBR7826947.1 polysaccharide deacetylase family protein [Actinospica acidithermotolerans]